MPQIYNAEVQELIEARANGLRRMKHNDVTTLVLSVVRILSRGASEALQGIDAENDGITRTMWDCAVATAGESTDLVFPGWDGVEQPVPDVCSYMAATNVVAGRVARAIIILHGFSSGYGDDLTVPTAEAIIAKLEEAGVDLG